MTPVERDLADLLGFTSRAFIAIRAESWTTERNPHENKVRLETITAYADAACNTDRVGEALLCEGRPGAPERIAAEAEAQLKMLRDILERTPDTAPHTRRVWQDGIGILERIQAACFTPVDTIRREALEEAWIDISCAAFYGPPRTLP